MTMKKKLYEEVNQYVDSRFDEATGLLGAAGATIAPWLAAHPVLVGGATLAATNPFVYGPLAALAAYKGGKRAWKGIRRNILQIDNPEEFNFVRGGLFTRTTGERNKDLNQRIVKNVLGPYLKKDAAGNIVFDRTKLYKLKQEDPELYGMIQKLQKDIATGNNRSNLWMSRKHKDAIRTDLNDIEVLLSKRSDYTNPMPITRDAITTLNKNPLTRSLLYKYRKAEPGSAEKRNLYTQLMTAEKRLVNSRKDVKNNYMSDIVDDYIQKTPFYK